MKLKYLLITLMIQLLIQTINSWRGFGINKLKCGIAFKNPSLPLLHSGREAQSIVGGRESQNGSWPWMVKIVMTYKKMVPKYENKPNGPKILVKANDLCSGTIVHKYWILTAAHCTEQGTTKTIIYAGDVSPSRETGIPRTIVHKELYKPYKEYERGYDAVLIKVNEPFIFSRASNINKICLPNPKKRINERSECYTMGWGIKTESHENPIESQRLKEMNLNFYDKHKCLADERIPEGDRKYYANQSIICSDNRQSYPSHGDSGSPFLCRENNIYTIHGILSGEVANMKITMYANVYNLVSWINKTIKSLQLN